MLMIFENKEVEVFEWNGQILFNPYHVGECLEISPEGVRKAITRMSGRQVIKLTNSKVTDSNFRKLHNTGENFLTESGVYKLIFKSKKKEAEKFQDWVTDEVLPQIRQTGGYIPTKEEESDEEFLARALLVAQRTLEKKNKELEEKNKVIEEQKPKVEFYDKVLNPTDEENGFTKLLTTTEVAKDLGMTARQLNNILHEKRIIYKKGKTWVLYSKYDHLISEKYCDYFINEFGNLLKWTEKGRKFIIELLEKQKISSSRSHHLLVSLNSKYIKHER